MSIDFAQGCILIAFILTALVIRKYFIISFLLFVNFMVFEVSAVIILDLLNKAKDWPLHLVYCILSGLTVILLVKMKASPALYAAMLIYCLYNYLILYEFMFHKSVGLHDNFKPVARTQMVIELLYMFLMSKGGRCVFRLVNKIRSRDNDYNYFVDRICASRFRLGFSRSL